MEKIIFKDGILGFEEYKDYHIELNQEEENPFQRLQSKDTDALSFIIMDPFLIKKDYDFMLTESTIEKLEIEDVKDVLVFTIVTIPNEDIKSITTNLLAPIIINSKKNLAKQIVLTDTDYTTKHNIIESGA